MRTALSMTTLVLIVLTTSTAGLHAQVQSGRVVRWQSDYVTRRAVFKEALPGGRILVNLADSAIVLDPAATEIEYRNGSRTKWGSAGIGLAVGGLIGAAAGFASGDDECSPGWFGCLFAYTAGEKAGAGAVAGGFLGGLVGLVFIPASKWIPLRTDSAPAVALLVEPQRLGVSVRF